MKDIPTLIAVYRQNDNDENSYNGRFIYSSYCQNGKVGNIKALDYATYILQVMKQIKQMKLYIHNFRFLKTM